MKGVLLLYAHHLYYQVEWSEAARPPCSADFDAHKYCHLCLALRPRLTLTRMSLPGTHTTRNRHIASLVLYLNVPDLHTVSPPFLGTIYDLLTPDSHRRISIRRVFAVLGNRPPLPQVEPTALHQVRYTQLASHFPPLMASWRQTPLAGFRYVVSLSNGRLLRLPHLYVLILGSPYRAQY
jgi:hypothetical protein